MFSRQSVGNSVGNSSTAFLAESLAANPTPKMLRMNRLYTL